MGQTCVKNMRQKTEKNGDTYAVPMFEYNRDDEYQDIPRSFSESVCHNKGFIAKRKRKGVTYAVPMVEYNRDDEYQDIPRSLSVSVCHNKGFIAKQKREDCSNTYSRIRSECKVSNIEYSYSINELNETQKINCNSRGNPAYYLPRHLLEQNRLNPACLFRHQQECSNEHGNCIIEEMSRTSILTTSDYSSLRSIRDSSEIQLDAEPLIVEEAVWDFDSLYQSEESFYPMNNRRRGYCIILNITHIGQAFRQGTEVDVTRFKESFECLGFFVIIKEDPTKLQIIALMNRYASKDHSQDDCFVCAIFSHGRDGFITSACGKDVSLESIINPVKECKSLLGKPKLFFIQACRGNNRDRGITVDAVADMQNVTHSVHADVLVSYATISEYVAYRDKNDGSIYVKILSELLKREGFTTKLMDLMLKVTDITSKFKVQTDFCQVPTFESTLTKSLRFTPKKRIAQKTILVTYDDGTTENLDDDEIMI